MTKTKTQQQFLDEVKQIHGDAIDLTGAVYVNNATHVKVGCNRNPSHGTWNVTPNHLLSGRGCPKCANEKQTKTQQQFVDEVKEEHGDAIDLTGAVYVNNATHVTVRCNRNPSHGTWNVTPNNLLKGRGCPKCVGSISKMSQKWLDSLSIPNILGETREVVLNVENKMFRVDGFDPQTNTVYEFHGDMWHGNPEIFNLNDINPVNKKTYGELLENTQKRSRLLKSAGYNVVSVWQNHWEKIEKELKEAKGDM